MAANATNFSKVLNGTISNIKDSIFMISCSSPSEGQYPHLKRPIVSSPYFNYILSQIVKSKLHKQCIVLNFLKDTFPKKVIDAAEVINTEHFKVHKLGDGTHGKYTNNISLLKRTNTTSLIYSSYIKYNY